MPIVIFFGFVYFVMGVISLELGPKERKAEGEKENKKSEALRLTGTLFF